MIRRGDQKRANLVLGTCIAFEVLIVLMLLWGEWSKDGWREEPQPTQVLPSPNPEFNTEGTES